MFIVTSSTNSIISFSIFTLQSLWEAMSKSDNQVARQVGQDMKDKPENEAGSIVSTAIISFSIFTL